MLLARSMSGWGSSFVTRGASTWNHEYTGGLLVKTMWTGAGPLSSSTRLVGEPDGTGAKGGGGGGGEGGPAGGQVPGGSVRPLRAKFGRAWMEGPGKEACQDSYFISHLAQAFGVADGVGGWPSPGPEIWAESVMEKTGEAIEAHEREKKEKTIASLRAALKTSVERTFREHPLVEGSTTAVVAQIVGRTLNVLNLGDSRVMLATEGRPFKGKATGLVAEHRTEEQQHDFNCPYALGLYSDRPEKAVEYVWPIRAGDVVVAATDGLWDNMFEDDVIKTLQKLLPDDPEERAAVSSRELDEVADKLLAQTISNYRGEGRPTPWSDGKPDDVTIVLVVVGHAPPPKRNEDDSSKD